ncbi:MAG: hypothetical protein KJO98_16230, partial [Rhodothermia bacterium]|nr:hypothetical protein [Rhodothermia bacterium]
VGSGDDNIHLRVNTRFSKDYGLKVMDTVVDTVYFAGIHTGNAIGTLGGFNNRVVHFENVLVQDPFAVAMGWTGASTNTNNDYNQFGKKTVGVWFNNNRTVEGSIELQYGWSHWFVYGAYRLGSSASQPLVITYKDLGFTESGVRVSTVGALMQAGKSDGLDGVAPRSSAIGGIDGPGLKYMKIVCDNSNFGYGLRQPLLMHAERAESSGTATVEVGSYNDVTVVNCGGEGDDILGSWLWGSGSGDEFTGFHRWRGDDSNPSMLGGRLYLGHGDGVYSGQWHDLQLEIADGHANPTFMRCVDVKIQDVTLTGAIRMQPACENVAIDNVAFVGAARTVINISSGSSVAANNVTAPLGSIISGSGTLNLNGTNVSLPYTFDGSEGSPNSSDSSQQLDLSRGWNLVSLNVEPIDLAVERLVEDVRSDLVIVKDGIGNVYYPEFGIDTIGQWDLSTAYQLNIDSAATINVTGSGAIDPATPISLGSGWNLIPYVLESSLGVDQALTSIGDALVMIKDGEGRVFYPELGITTLESLVPGQGYSVYVDRPATLVYGN